ncbi:MAG: response regulator [Chitinophagaceae bacterium]|nr:MAG: response regulator [Chitinophagaceae bacterium]
MEQQKRTILVIDDDGRNIFALTATLRSKGYKCISAGSVSEAIDLLKATDGTGIILLDMMMPDMDGYEAIPRFKNLAESEGLPIIAVTAQAMKGDRERCIAAGADDYIAKPVNVDMLLGILKRYIG